MGKLACWTVLRELYVGKAVHVGKLDTLFYLTDGEAYGFSLIMPSSVREW